MKPTPDAAGIIQISGIVGRTRSAVGIDSSHRALEPVMAGGPLEPTPPQIRSALLYRSRELFGTSGGDLLRRSCDGETALPAVPFDRHDPGVPCRSCLPNRQQEDRWIAFDKVQHLTFSFLWTLGTQYVAVNKITLSEHHALPLSIASSAAVGLGKEVYDHQLGPTRYFSYKDLAADALGIVLAAGIILL